MKFIKIIVDICFDIAILTTATQFIIKERMMISVMQAVKLAKKEHKVLVKVIYFNKSFEFYVCDKVPDKNEYIPDGYCGDVVVLKNYAIN